MRLGYDNTAFRKAQAKLPKADGKKCIICRGKIGKYKRKYCSNECYNNWYGQFVQRDWGEIRERAKKRDNYTCQHCGIQEKDASYEQRLEVHHLMPIKDGGKEFEVDNTITLCHKCHVIEHRRLKHKCKTIHDFKSDHMTLNIERIDIKELKDAPYNPRKDLQLGDPEYHRIKDSIENHGYVQPIVWNKTSGHVVGGHQRLKVLKDMGVGKVEVVVVELNEKNEKAMNLALNKAVGDWDEKKLVTLLQDAISEEYIDLTGFLEDEVDELNDKLTMREKASLADDTATVKEGTDKCPSCGFVLKTYKRKIKKGNKK